MRKCDYTMRKILLFIGFVSFIGQIHSQQVTLLSEGFESTFPPSGWLLADAAGPPPVFPWVKQNGTGEIPAVAPKTDTCTAMFECFAIPAGYSSYMITSAVDLSNYENAQVNFSMYRDFDALDPFSATADQLSIYASVVQDIVGAVVLGTVQRNSQLQPPEASNGWYDYSFDIPMEVFAGGNVYIIIEGLSQSGNNIYIDDFSVSTTSAVPDCATNQMPADLTTGVCSSSDVSLSWGAVADAIGYKLFLGSDDPPTNLENGTDLGNVTSYMLSAPLLINTTYSWQVIPYNADRGAIGCGVLTFETNPSVDPIVEITKDSLAVCIGDSLLFPVLVSDGNVSIPGAYSFDWTGTDVAKLSSTTVESPKFGSNVQNEQFKYFLTATDDSLCQGIDSVIVYVKEFPTAGVISASEDTVCIGEVVVTSITGEDGTIDWNISGDGTSYSSLNSTANPYDYPYQIGLNYVIAVVEKANCYDTSNVVQIRASASPDKPVFNLPVSFVSFCAGDSALIPVSNYSDNLLWSDGMSTTPNYYAKESGDFNVTYTDPITACSSVSDFVNASEIIVDKPMITSDITVICAGETVLIYCLNYETDLTWNDALITTNDSLFVTETGDYKVYYEEPVYGCVDSSDVITTTVNPAPDAPNITQSNDTLFANVSGDIKWYDELDNEVGTGDYYKVLDNGTYYATNTSVDNCVTTSASIVVTDVGVSSYDSGNRSLSIYPNPSNGTFNIDNALPNTTITIVNNLGEKLSNHVLMNNHEQIKIDLPVGIYFMIIKNGRDKIIEKILIKE
ncbi:MAG: hypothetical protein ACJAUV_000062 [Flavobacteriales bacterium]